MDISQPSAQAIDLALYLILFPIPLGFVIGMILCLFADPLKKILSLIEKNRRVRSGT